MTVDQQFTVLNDKLQLLLRQYNRLQKENIKLKEELLNTRTGEMESSSKIHELNEQLNILKVGSGEMTGRDKKEFEKRSTSTLRKLTNALRIWGNDKRET